MTNPKIASAMKTSAWHYCPACGTAGCPACERVRAEKRALYLAEMEAREFLYEFMDGKEVQEAAVGLAMGAIAYGKKQVRAASEGEDVAAPLQPPAKSRWELLEIDDAPPVQPAGEATLHPATAEILAQAVADLPFVTEEPADPPQIRSSALAMEAIRLGLTRREPPWLNSKRRRRAQAEEETED